MRRFFKGLITEFLASSVMPQKRVLLVGGGDTDILASLSPARGVHLCDGQADCAGLKNLYPAIEFTHDRLPALPDEEFDYLILDDYLHFENNLDELFSHLRRFMHEGTRVFIICVNPLSIFALTIAAALGLATPRLDRNILRLGDLENLARVFGYELLDKGYRFALPFRLLGIGRWLNALIPRIPVVRRLCFGQYLVLRLPPARRERLSCSVVVPCYNEEGNIAECLERIPDWCAGLEIIVVDDGSTDRTRDIVKALAERRKNIRLIPLPQNRGKGYAVNEGWKSAAGDVLMMLDADMTTPPEELPVFHRAMECGAEFINGTRIVYPREKHSLGRVNRIGVTFFALLISWITQRRITDTFCGTKAFLGRHRSLFAIEEFLWGDWDLFFAAARYRLKMVEIPVHYKARRAGEAKMRPFRHGFMLLKSSAKGLWLVR